MPITIHFMAHDSHSAGAATSLGCATGQSLMQAAVGANVRGIEADCGGLLTCGTCHVYVREPHASMLPAPSPDERGMLEFVASPRQANSRLSCQLTLADALDGLTVDLPASQY